MKSVKIRIVQLNLFLWGSLFIFTYAINLIKALKQAISSNQTVDINGSPLMFATVVYSILTFLWIRNEYKEYKGKKFLKMQIVILDEDERSQNIHYHAAENAMNIVQFIAVLMLIVAFIFGYFEINIEIILLAIVVLYSIYSLVYYLYLKKLYYA